MAQNVKVSLSSSQAPTCSFDFVPSPEGFKLFSELKQSALTQPITITMGYMNLKAFTQSFRYVGMDLTTGIDPKIRVDAVGLLKGPFTDNRISYAMEKKIPLKELPQFLLGQLDPKPELKFVFTKEALEVIADAEHQENQLERSPYSILTSAIRPYGLRLDPGSSAFADTISISVAPSGKAEGTVSQGQQPVAGERRAHIVGPGLAINLNRKQKFNIGQSSAGNGKSKKNNVSTEQDQKQAQPPQSGSQQPATANAKTPTAVEGPSNPQSSAESRSTGTTTAQAQKARVDETKILTTELSFTAPMLPNFMAIAPRDLIMVPALKGPGGYIEDWEVDTVGYTQDSSGSIMINIKANRPYIGDENVAAPSVIQEVRGIVSNLTTPEAWARYYWGQ